MICPHEAHGVLTCTALVDLKFLEDFIGGIIWLYYNYIWVGGVRVWTFCSNYFGGDIGLQIKRKTNVEDVFGEIDLLF